MDYYDSYDCSLQCEDLYDCYNYDFHYTNIHTYGSYFLEPYEGEYKDDFSIFDED